MRTCTFLWSIYDDLLITLGCTLNDLIIRYFPVFRGTSILCVPKNWIFSFCIFRIYAPIENGFPNDFEKNIPFLDDCRLVVSLFFIINHGENFEGVFLETIFFETVTTITKKVFCESSWFSDWIFIEHASSVRDARFILFSFFALL